MPSRSDAQRAAEARYEKKRRGVAVTLRMTLEQSDWLRAQQQTGESRAAAVKRLAGMPM